MYVYYILRGTQAGEPVEAEDEITPDLLPGTDMGDGPSIISALVQKLRATGNTAEWENCDLTDDVFDHEDSYIYFNQRWMRRSDAPWRKDRYN